MAKKRKQPKQKVVISPEKRAVTIEAPDLSHNHVTWSFKRFDGDTAWGGKKNHHRESFSEIASKLRSLEGMTWRELEQKDHPCERNKLCKEAQNRLRDLKMDDYDELFRFRIGSRQRLWGVRTGALFLVLWWDPEHEVYPSSKKNT